MSVFPNEQEAVSVFPKPKKTKGKTDEGGVSRWALVHELARYLALWAPGTRGAKRLVDGHRRACVASAAQVSCPLYGVLERGRPWHEC